MISMIDLIAGLAWEPYIRGLLTVVLALSILGGSVWLLLVTNTGTRLGSLIALAGFWGWLFIMGMFWWIYGIGWVGSSPLWHVEDVFADEPGVEVAGIGDAFIGNVEDLPDTNCNDGIDSFPPAGGVASINVSSDRVSLCTPRAIELLMDYPEPKRELVIRELLNPQTEESKIENIIADRFGNSGTDPAAMLAELTQNQRDEVFDAVVAARYDEIRQNIIDNNEALGSDDSRYLTGAALAERIAVGTESQDIRIDDISLSSLESTAPEIIDWAVAQGLVEFDGWNLQSTAQAGEAAATADAYLREELFPDGDFIVLDAFQQGGKPKRNGDGLWDRVAFTFTDAARITHPTNYTVVNVQQTLDRHADPALPPPIPEADPEASTYSVVMIRDLGNRRLVPALFTIFSLAIFLVTCAVLHWRDLGLRNKGIDV